MNFKRLWYSFRMLTFRSGNQRTNYLKKHKVYAGMGENVMIQSRKIPLYPELIKFGNNVRVASNVSFITHDVIHNVLNRMQPPFAGGGGLPEKVGCIEIGNNVFIGANSTILYDVKIGDNVIVAAGSVVTKDIPGGTVYGGVPARQIGVFNDVIEKRLQERELKKYQIQEVGNIPSEAIDAEWQAFYDRRLVR